MIISVDEGNKLATSFVSSFCASFEKNNHDENMLGFFDGHVAWKWSDGSEGEGSPDALMHILKNGWGKMFSFATYTKPFVCVDTEKGRIVITVQMIMNVNARMESVCNIVVATVTDILLVNADKKVVRWSAKWDNNNEDFIQASTKLGVEFPKAEKLAMRITKSGGEAFADKILNAISDGYLKNNHAETCRDFVAENVSWDWSDGTKGSGTHDDMCKCLSKTWGCLFASWIPVEPIVTVDTTNGVVVASFHCVSNMTGGFIDENNPICMPLAFAFHLDENHKAFKVNGCWDNNDATLQAAVVKITAKLEAASVTAVKILTVDSPTTGMVTGQ